MTRNTADAGAAQAFVEQRRARLFAILGRTPETVAGDAEPLPAERLSYLRHEAEELYWNELVWEELTDEEAITGGHLTEMVFPAFLAFVDGLLVDRVAPDSRIPASPHPDAVEEILLFLAERYAEASADLENGCDSQKVVWARLMARHLIDLSLCRLYRLDPAEQELLEND
ncbi:hypothetical protein [Longimicrobium sp.]|uniref:hypothetical protein n=1 Tax=Longimicrobium sp. TaxID=2029185 RepID=UPI002BDB53D9|nr:hypothetical protein [Longimicrobium sp.]HSU17178.1 hypothetical protein [Longimicrobium sp.]